MGLTKTFIDQCMITNKFTKRLIKERKVGVLLKDSNENTKRLDWSETLDLAVSVLVSVCGSFLLLFSHLFIAFVGMSFVRPKSSLP